MTNLILARIVQRCASSSKMNFVLIRPSIFEEMSNKEVIRTFDLQNTELEI